MIASAPWKRRRFLAAMALLAAPARAFAGGEEAEVEAVKQIARKAGIAGLKSDKNEQYLAIGDAPDGFRSQAMELCSALAKDYLKAFAAKGFPAEKPKGRLTMVLLSGPQTFAAYCGDHPPQTVGGFYDVDTNRLVMFDNRRNDQVARALLVNTIALMHEATHQLTYNTGLLDRGGDVPVFLSEGLAMYGETRRPNGKGKVGDVNAEWMPVLRPRGEPMAELIPVADLLAGDDLLNDNEKAHLARAQSWLIVHYLMKNPQRSAKFRSYLDAIRPRRDAKNRPDDWDAAFGPFDRLDRELVSYLKKL